MAVIPDTGVHDALARVATGGDVRAADLPAHAARAVRLARDVGAPLGPVLADLAVRDDDDAAARRALRRAGAQGRAAAVGLTLAPPVLGLALGALAAGDPLAALRSPLGRLLLLLGAACWLLGVGAVVALVRRAGRVGDARPRSGAGWLAVAVAVAALVHPVVGLLAGLPALLVAREPDAPEDLDEVLVLAGVAVRAGLPLGAALRRVGGVLPAHADLLARLALWLELGALGPPPDGSPSALDVLARAHRDGAPVLPALERLATAHRTARQQVRLEAAERLPVALTGPTALLLLPAALLVALAPLADLALAPLG